MAVDQLTAQEGAQGGLTAGHLVDHFVCRVGGLPVHSLEELRAEASAQAAETLLGIERSLHALQEALTDGLYQAIHGLEDQKLRRRLLKLKRNIHNLRAVSEKDVVASQTALAADFHEALVRYLELTNERRETHTRLLDLYAEELSAIRRRFQSLVEDEDFNKGLRLSSQVLSDQVRRYTRAGKNPGSKVRQVERSLLRYFSRMVMKATPFSTFCAIVPGTISEATTAPPTFDGAPQRKHSHLRLNKSLFAILLEHLTQRPGVREHLEVELNPTLGEEEGRLLFLSARRGAEIFQRLPRNPVIDLLQQRLAASPLPLGTLVEDFARNPEIDASADEVAAYVDRLLEIGLFRFRLGIREQEVDWDLPLREILAPLDDEHAQKIVTFLQHLRDDMESFARATAQERRGLLSAAVERTRSVFEDLEARMRPTAEMPPFYEDAAGNARLEVSAAGLEQTLAEYVALTSRLSWLHGEQASCRHFFDTYYSDPEPVPLLRFYEDFYREHFKSHLERQRSPGKDTTAAEPPNPEVSEEGTQDPTTYDAQNPFQLPVIEALQQAHKTLAERIMELWRDDPEGAEITLGKKDLETALRELPTHPEPCRSVSVFGQYLPEFTTEGDPALVMGGYLNGYGKYFSRHLYLLPDTVQEGLRQANVRLTDQKMAEICGDASFNANLHPPLLPWEVSYPTGESGASDEQIKSSHLFVDADPRNPHRLRLRHGAAGKEVIPVDLGFLNPRMRPPLYQLLSRFTPPGNFHLKVPEQPLPPQDLGDTKHSQGALYRPRVSYGGHLILSRRCWWIFPGMFPHRLPNEGDAAYFLRVWQWREDLGIPQEVFIRVRSLPAPPKSADTDMDPSTKTDSEAESRTGRDSESGTDTESGTDSESGTDAESGTDTETASQVKEKRQVQARPPVRKHLYKPQYIDFKNPLLVDLFSRTTENLEHFVISVEECLPDREHLLAVREGARYDTEFVLQVDFRKNHDAA